jgi:hypothetical protein
MRRRLVIPYWLFGTNCRSNLQGPKISRRDRASFLCSEYCFLPRSLFYGNKQTDSRNGHKFHRCQRNSHPLKYSAPKFRLTLQNESSNHEILSYLLCSLLPLISSYFPQYLLLSNTLTKWNSCPHVRKFRIWQKYGVNFIPAFLKTPFFNMKIVTACNCQTNELRSARYVEM